MPADLRIAEIAPADAPRELLLLADPSPAKLESYLPGARCFAADTGAVPVGACAIVPLGPGVFELMSIAVSPDAQRRGIGTALLRHAIAVLASAGATRLEVGTGSFGYQLAFYQRQGFRVERVDRDFFVRTYPEPIVEDGIRLRDMLRLALELPSEPVRNP